MDENHLFRTVRKRIYERWNEQLQQWDFIKIEFIYEAPDTRCVSTPCVGFCYN